MNNAARPILMSAPMIRALIVGTKRQTRRILKNPEYYGCPTGDCPHWQQAECNVAMQALAGECPYGKPSDLLWVRERAWIPREASLQELREGADTWIPDYYADGITDIDSEQYRDWGWKSTPSIHMPRWASRLTLELTDVRVQRLNKMNEHDCIEEGINYRCPSCGYTHRDAANLMDHSLCKTKMPPPHEFYKEIWEGINGQGSWEKNPWVWVLTFKVHKQNVDTVLKHKENAQ
jgi:hypothetical protein